MYTNEFFTLYRDYLNEPRVRDQHNTAFDLFEIYTGCNIKHVIDLGCGLMEYKDRGVYVSYQGYDKVPSSPEVEVLDYTTIQKLPKEADTVVSLFSIEACLPNEEKYKLYNTLFANNPKLKFMLSSGFYYNDSRKNTQIVEEAGGITSYQTIDELGLYSIDGVEEQRLTMKTPSKLFGPTVVEVYKMFKRVE